MKKVLGIATVLAAGAAACATPVLQFDINGFGTQSVNASNVSVPFGGLTHTGAVNFSTSTGALVGIFIQSVVNGPFHNAGFSGSTLSGFTGQVTRLHGPVTG